MNLCMRVMSVNCSISMCVHVCAAPRQRGRSCVKTNFQTDLWDRDEPAGTREGMRACVCILCVLVPVTKNGFHGIDLSDMWRTCGKLPWRHTRRGREGGRDTTEPDVRMLLFSFYQWAVSLSLRRKGRNKLKKREDNSCFLSLLLRLTLSSDLYWPDPLSSQHIDFKPVLLTNEHHRLFVGAEIHRHYCEEAAS